MEKNFENDTRLACDFNELKDVVIEIAEKIDFYEKIMTKLKRIAISNKLDQKNLEV